MNLERKYLLRLRESVFSESDRYFKAALTTLRHLHKRGEVVRVDFDGNEYAPDDPIDRDVVGDVFWQITDKGLERVARK